MATLFDIAREAQVSICAVSRYLNGKISIRPQTAARIDATIERIGYVPNSAARTLKTNMTSNVAILIPAMDNLLFAENIEQAGAVFQRNHFLNFIYSISNDIQCEAAITPVLAANLVRGVIFNTLPINFRDFSHLDPLLKKQIPFVFVNRLFSPGPYPSIYVNYREGIGQVIDHLALSGRKRIGLIIGSKRQPQSMENIRGYRDGLGRNELPFNEDLVCETGYELSAAQAATARLVANKVDAICCITDLLALHVLDYCKMTGIAVPGDIAVTGAGNTRFCTIVEPQLSSLDIKNALLGRYSAELLLRLIRNEQCDMTIVLEPELVIRASST